MAMALVRVRELGAAREVIAPRGHGSLYRRPHGRLVIDLETQQGALRSGRLRGATSRAPRGLERSCRHAAPGPQFVKNLCQPHGPPDSEPGWAHSGWTRPHSRRPRMPRAELL